MGRVFCFMLSAFICLCLTSCSGIFRTTYYTTDTAGWKKLKPCSEGGITYTYGVTPDMVILNVRGPGTSAISVGPIFFPFAFPTCLQFWVKEEPKLIVAATLYMNQSGTIYPQSIRFTDNEGYMMTPTMIESLDIVHEQDVTKLDSTAIVQGIKTSGAIRLRWHFRGNQARKKEFCVLIDTPTIIGKDGKPLLIRFRRKTVYEYIPFFGH
ncbi:MAG: hypothetical protein ACFNM7_00500 [Prevotella conceptionensis]